MNCCGKNMLIIGGGGQSALVHDKLRKNGRSESRHLRVLDGACIGEQAIDQSDLVFVCDDLRPDDRRKIINSCHARGKRVALVPDFYEVYFATGELGSLDDIPVIELRSLRHSRWWMSAKRMFDLIVAVTAILVLWPLLLVLALLIKLDSPGPVFYTQTRVGMDGKHFNIFKFRTMCQDAEKESGPVLSTLNDPRITRVGARLRATRLDELPQLFNVVRGDMSIVGPRPERPSFVEKYNSEIPEYEYRHNIRPGITGMAQVYGKYSTTVRDKLVYDLFYIGKAGFCTDVSIMVQTVRVLLNRESSQGIPAPVASEKASQPAN